jgi:hypothetical protein
VNTYKSPNEDYFIRRIQTLNLLYTDFLNEHERGFVINSETGTEELHDCISRVHQREYYYKVFHHMPDGVSEVKRIALYCYWILKYKPFRTTLQSYRVHKAGKEAGSEGEKECWEWYSQYFNERFCLYLLTNALHKGYKGEKVKKLPLTDQAINGLLYSLKHQDMSEDILVEIFELIEDVANQAFVRYEKIPTHKG